MEFITGNKETVLKVYKIMAVPLWELEFTEWELEFTEIAGEKNRDSRDDIFEVSCRIHYMTIKQIKEKRRTI